MDTRTEHLQLSYASGSGDVPLIGRTIGDDLAATVARLPDHEALVDVPTGRRWTYAELDAAVDRVASALLHDGVAKGDRVGIWSPNCAEWVLVQYATARIGAVLVNINPAYRTHELQYVLEPVVDPAPHRCAVVQDERLRRDDRGRASRVPGAPGRGAPRR